MHTIFYGKIYVAKPPMEYEEDGEDGEPLCRGCAFFGEIEGASPKAVHSFYLEHANALCLKDTGYILVEKGA